ncbi:MAG: DUF2279 domain-containing protein [Saprospiraceae bacterium]|nr:DUF2279 domain-containing protein [Saprospiraceae bacterium]
MRNHFFLLLVCAWMSPVVLSAQRCQPPLLSLRPADTLYKARLWTAAGAGTGAYTLAMAGLYNSWYAEYPQSDFHFFDDGREWMQMDKMGHWLMSYQESRWIAGGARWTGINRRAAAWTGFAGGQLIQTSFEIFDGYSAQWGFSWGDVAFNLLGSGMFLGQELGWGEQRIMMKMSAWPVRYNDTPIDPYQPAGSQQWTTLERRADELYGTAPLNLFLKNYNTLVVWASVNPRSFSRQTSGWWPRWLNVAVGMGADNLFAGQGYEWNAVKDCEGADCVTYRIDPVQYPRTRQFFLSLDLDLSRIRTRSRFLNTLLDAANIIKIPAPALELNSQGRFRVHPIYF